MQSRKRFFHMAFNLLASPLRPFAFVVHVRALRSAKRAVYSPVTEDFLSFRTKRNPFSTTHIKTRGSDKG